MPLSSLMAGPVLRPPERDAFGPGIAFAVAAHLLLVVALAWGVAWHSHQEDAVEAELWSAVPQAEAPPPVVVTPLPTPPAPPPEPTPPPRVEEPPPDLVVEKHQHPKPEPQREKKHKEVETFDSTPPKPRKDPTEAPDLKARQAREQAAKDKAARDQAERDAQARRQAEEQAKAQAAIEAQRQRNLRDILNRAGGGQNPSANTGQAQRSSGPSAAYVGRLRALFKRNLNWAFEDVAGNPETVVEITTAPDGTILSKLVTTPSGVPAWDDAVVRAIERTEVLPADETGKVQPKMTLRFKMKDY